MLKFCSLSGVYFSESEIDPFVVNRFSPCGYRFLSGMWLGSEGPSRTLWTGVDDILSHIPHIWTEAENQKLTFTQEEMLVSEADNNLLSKLDSRETYPLQLWL